MPLYLTILILTVLTLNAYPLPRAQDPILLTPGPITTSLAVKKSMLHDYGSRDTKFTQINKKILDRLLAIANATETHVAIPLQGSGTFIVEAMLQTLVSTNDHLLIVSNGAYGRRMAKICARSSISYTTLEFTENEPVNTDLLASFLSEHPEITHVATVYCETTTGILNPIKEIAQVVANAQKKLLIDAISAFGALPFNARSIPFDAVAISSNKCLQGVPGCGYCLVKKESILQAEGNAKSLSLDLHDQWHIMEKTGQWRFTPPIQVISALHKALEELEHEGGITAREKRYQKNLRTLLNGMAKFGFKLYIDPAHQAPIIATFLTPDHANFNFNSFYNRLKDKNFIIYPGKLTKVNSFRIGCIGNIDYTDIQKALAAIKEVMQELHITQKDVS